MQVIFAVRADVADMQHPDLPHGIPLEIALPWRHDHFLEQMDKLPALEAYLIENRVNVSSIHAPQGKISADSSVFREWALPTMRLAQTVRARLVVFHPDRVPIAAKPNLQIVARSNLKQLQHEFSDVLVAVETFVHDRRILTPEEIVHLHIPLVADVSHLKPERTLALIDAYHAGIPACHLSEVGWHPGFGKHHTHMPAGPVCQKVLEALSRKAWSGVITLEYLSEFRDRMYQDRQMLEATWAD